MKPDITATKIEFTSDMSLLDRVISTWALVAWEGEHEWPRVRDVTVNRVRLVWLDGPNERTRRVRLSDCRATHEKAVLYEFIKGMTQQRHLGREHVLITLGIDHAKIPTRLSKWLYMSYMKKNKEDADGA